jgi:hypothetical protein
VLRQKASTPVITKQQKFLTPLFYSILKNFVFVLWRYLELRLFAAQHERYDNIDFFIP